MSQAQKIATPEQVAVFDRGVSAILAAGLEAGVSQSGEPGRRLVWVLTYVQASHADLPRLAGLVDETNADLTYRQGGRVSLFLSRPPTADELADDELWR